MTLLHRALVISALAAPAVVFTGCGQLAQDGPPTCVITAPEAAADAFRGEGIAFAVQGADGGTTTELIAVAWRSSLGDALPVGTLDPDGVHAFSTADLSVGAHTISAIVTDKQGESCVDSVEVVVRVGEPPHIGIVVPLADGYYYVDRPLTLRAEVSDAEDAADALRVHWAVVGGAGLAEGIVPDADGATSIERSFEVGEHELVATVIDSHGNHSQDTVTVRVGGPNEPPECRFTAPLDGDAVPQGAPLELHADATDPNVPSPLLSVRFFVDGEPVGDAVPDDDGDASVTVSDLDVGERELTVVVEDDVGLTCEASITVRLDAPPTAQIVLPTAATVPSDNLPIALSGLVADAEDPADTLSVRWLIAGAMVADAPADAAGVVTDQAPPQGAGPLTLTLEVTDSVGGVGTDSVSLDVNAAPSAPGVDLTPGVPVTIDDLISAIDVPSTDPEGDPLGYEYTWLRDGVVEAGQDGATLTSALTAHFETWTVEVRANDGHTLGAPGTASVTIDNTPPLPAGATVSPVLGAQSGTFSLTTTGWSDVDGDPEGYLYQWVVAGVAVPGATSATFSPGAAGDPGDPLHCELTPWDGFDVGPMFLSAPAFINAPATAGSVTIAPTTAFETTTLQATVTGVNDPEGAATTLVYQWYTHPGGTPTPIAGATSPALTGADFDHFDTVSVGVSVDDGVEIGPELMSNLVTIQNTIPQTTTPSVTPALLYTNTLATCQAGPVTDPDPDTTSLIYSWTVAGQVVPNETTSTLDGSLHFDKGQFVGCTVTPSDGWTTGAPLSSNLRGVLNTPPTAPVVEITPQSPSDDNPLDCVAATPSTDPDPTDTVTYSRSWSKSTGSTPYTAQTLQPSVTAIGDVWTCSMSPWDGSAAGPPGSDTVTVQPEITLVPDTYDATYSQQAQTRGLWFTAPINMAITGLYVPDDTHGGDLQNVQVVLLPGSFGPSSSDAGTTLLYAPGSVAGDRIVTNIPVLAGDKIGILGARGDATIGMHSNYSLTHAPVSGTLDGVAVQLHRLEYNANLFTSQAGVVTDATGPIGRVEIDYIP